ncbi:MAG: hypothetical protein NVSMB9_37430 [Isosphaeraceae bacterium]
MRIHLVRLHNGKPHILWASVLTLMAISYLVVLVLAELFWYFFTGGFSALIGGFALVMATLFIVRVVGERVAMPIALLETQLESWES